MTTELHTKTRPQSLLCVTCVSHTKAHSAIPLLAHDDTATQRLWHTKTMPHTCHTRQKCIPRKLWHTKTMPHEDKATRRKTMAHTDNATQMPHKTHKTNAAQDKSFVLCCIWRVCLLFLSFVCSTRQHKTTVCSTRQQMPNAAQNKRQKRTHKWHSATHMWSATHSATHM